MEKWFCSRVVSVLAAPPVTAGNWLRVQKGKVTGLCSGQQGMVKSWLELGTACAWAAALCSPPALQESPLAQLEKPVWVGRDRVKLSLVICSTSLHENVKGCKLIVYEAGMHIP